jgi:crossover junction endonuclease EME1
LESGHIFLDYVCVIKQVHEKEILLKDLVMEGILGNGERRLGEVCSKRVYRILMAQSGHMKTDDVEDGADFF